MIKIKILQYHLAALLLLMLSSCTHNISDLDAQINEIMSRPGIGIAPLPELKPYTFYVYQSGKKGTRDPFHTFFKRTQEEVDEEQKVGLNEEIIRELEHRNREELESFELDGLIMVGTLHRTDNLWAIVLDPEGAVHRVEEGNYMGKNIGKITGIFEDKIYIREIIQNSQGRWEEREAMLTLTEPKTE